MEGGDEDGTNRVLVRLHLDRRLPDHGAERGRVTPGGKSEDLDPEHNRSRSCLERETPIRRPRARRRAEDGEQKPRVADRLVTRVLIRCVSRCEDCGRE